MSNGPEVVWSGEKKFTNDRGTKKLILRIVSNTQEHLRGWVHYYPEVLHGKDAMDNEIWHPLKVSGKDEDFVEILIASLVEEHANGRQKNIHLSRR